MPKIALVIGGAGFIGSHLLKRLSKSGDYEKLVCVDIAEPRFKSDDVIYKYADIRTPLDDSICSDATEIYNLAAIHTTPGYNDWEYFWTNILGAIHACDYARRFGVNTMVFTSSISIYGPTESMLEETADPAPISAYGRSKLSAEKIHQLWRSECPKERKLIIARPAVIYGYKEKGNFSRLADLLRTKRFYYAGRTDTIKSCGYVEDLLNSFSFTLNCREKEIIYNFAHKERFTTEDICNAFIEVSGYAIPRGVMPLPVMLLGAWGFEILNAIGLKNSINRERVMKLNKSTNIAPKKLCDLGFSNQYTLEDSLHHWRSMSDCKVYE